MDNERTSAAAAAVVVAARGVYTITDSAVSHFKSISIINTYTRARAHTHKHTHSKHTLNTLTNRNMNLGFFLYRMVFFSSFLVGYRI